MLDTKINKALFILILLIMAVMLSGCYTLVGPPPDAKEILPKKYSQREDIERDHDYYYDSSYDLGSWEEYDLYYSDSWYPYYYGRYWYQPWGYDGRDYWYNDGYYVPEKKPETKNRGASDFGRSSRTNQWRDESASADKQKKSDDDQQEKRDTESRRSPRRYRNEE